MIDCTDLDNINLTHLSNRQKNAIASALGATVSSHLADTAVDSDRSLSKLLSIDTSDMYREHDGVIRGFLNGILSKSCSTFSESECAMATV